MTKEPKLETLLGNLEVSNRKAWSEFNNIMETDVMRDKDLARQTAKLNFLIEILKNKMNGV